MGSNNLRVGNAVPGVPAKNAVHFMQIVTEGNDLEGIEPSKSFRNAEDSVPYGAPKESDKLKFDKPMPRVVLYRPGQNL